MTDMEQFKLAELSIRMFASPDTFAALSDEIHRLLEEKYEQSAWETAAQDDLTGDLEHRNVLERLRHEAEVVNGRRPREPQDEA